MSDLELFGDEHALLRRTVRAFVDKEVSLRLARGGRGALSCRPEPA